MYISWLSYVSECICIVPLYALEITPECRVRVKKKNPPETSIIVCFSRLMNDLGKRHGVQVDSIVVREGSTPDRQTLHKASAGPVIPDRVRMTAPLALSIETQ
ncbi:hypothetical protein K438DRAFT_1781833 [Mycena galopus ATCC 62051]|nr:hypothetical protein K438DRAFT_1781833 [Mycena galopus ATCC 62051]